MPSNVKTLNTSPSFLIKHTPAPWARRRLWHHQGFRIQQQVLPWRLEHYFFLICPQVQEAAQQHLCQTAVLLLDEHLCLSLTLNRDTKQAQHRKAPAWMITMMLHWAVETCSLTLAFPDSSQIPDTLLLLSWKACLWISLLVFWRHCS